MTFAPRFFATITASQSDEHPGSYPAPMTIIFGKGFDKTRDLIDCGVLTGVIVKNGGWLSYMDDTKKEPVEIKAHGEEELMEKLVPIMPKVSEKIHAVIKKLNEEHPNVELGTGA